MPLFYYQLKALTLVFLKKFWKGANPFRQVLGFLYCYVRSQRGLGDSNLSCEIQSTGSNPLQYPITESLANGGKTCQIELKGTISSAAMNIITTIS
jgi:hypothetical protein